jgi:hypothetical protein
MSADDCDELQYKSRKTLMQFSVHLDGIDITDEVKRQALGQIDLALDRLEKDIEVVSMYLVDTNGPLLGGVDKACRIVVQIRMQDSLIVEDIDARVDVVINRVTDRLGVVACKRADSLQRNRNLFRRWLVDSTDI